MEAVTQVLGWANYLLAWTWAIWFTAAVVIGGVMITLDEWRLHRTRPKPEEVRAYTDDLIARHGREAFRTNGEAMWQARLTKDFDRGRFLKEVSGELVRRFADEDALRDRNSLPDPAPRCKAGIISTSSCTLPLPSGQNPGTLHLEPQGGGSA